MGRRAVMDEPAEMVVHAGGGWALVHGLPLAAPGICCGLFALVVLGAHKAGGGDPIVTPLLAIAALVIGAALTVFGLMGAGSRTLMKVLVVVTGALATLNLVLGLIVGFVVWMAWFYGVSTLIIWTLWIIWRGMKYAGSTSTSASANGADDLFAAVKHAKAAFGPPKVDERGVVTATVRSLPGGTMADAQDLLPAISSHARGVRGGTTLAQHPVIDGEGTIKIATRDNLAKRIPWPGLAGLKLGSLPTDAFSIGERQSGPAMVRIVGDYEKDRAAQDIQPLKIGGTTRSGKSTGARVLLGSMMVKRRLNVIGLDLTKSLQTFGPLAPGLTWAITDEEVGRLFMHRIRHVIKGRTEQLASEGLMRWSLRSKLNLLVVWAEESKALRNMMRQYTDMVADAGSAGIWVVSSTQRWLHRSMSTDVRALSGAAIMFGVEESADAAAILPKDALEAIGQNLQLWGATKPGRAYMAGLGVPRQLWGDEVRFYDPLEEQLAEVVDAGEPYRSPMDDVTAELFGELYARRTIHPAADMAPAGWGRSTPAPPRERIVVPARPHDEYDDEDDLDEVGEEETVATAEEENAQDRQEMLDALGASLRAHLGDDAEARDLADVDAEMEISTDVPDPGEEPDLEAGSKPTPEEAQRIWDERLHELYKANVRRLETSTLTGWLLDVQRDRRFLYRQRDRWLDAKYIVETPDGEGWDLVASPLERRRESPPHGE